MNIFINTQKEDKQITTMKKLKENIVECLQNNGKPEMTDEEKAKMQENITQKLKAGKKLTKEEMDFLKKYNPQMYIHAMRVQRIAESVEEQLKHAKSKEEANRIMLTATAGIDKDDTDKEYIVAAVNRISKEFKQSSDYNRLPDTEEEAKGTDKRNNRFKTDDEDDDLKSWSPLQEIIDEMPKFNYGA